MRRSLALAPPPMKGVVVMRGLVREPSGRPAADHDYVYYTLTSADAELTSRFESWFSGNRPKNARLATDAGVVEIRMRKGEDACLFGEAARAWLADST